MRSAIILFLAISGLLVSFVGYKVMDLWTKPGPLPEIRNVVIEQGWTLKDISRYLQKKGVVEDSNVFDVMVRLFGFPEKLKAGEYRFRPRESAQKVYERIRDHRVTLRRLTVPEGWTSHRVVRQIENSSDLSDSLSVALDEGSVLPDTYLYRYGLRRNDIVLIMQKAMKDYIHIRWKNRSPALPIQTPYEMLIVASMVQAEASEDEDMRKVAGVIYNRLRQGIPLQIDSTIYYAITDLGRVKVNRELSRKDLGIDSPYNTYVERGLPPTPILNPGKKAIAAAANPALTSALYFVANGQGQHNFADTLTEHNRNVRIYRQRSR